MGTSAITLVYISGRLVLGFTKVAYLGTGSAGKTGTGTRVEPSLLLELDPDTRTTCTLFFEEVAFFVGKKYWMLMRQHGPCVLGIPHQNLVNLNGKMTFS
jgi:hypothetical protein